MNELDLVLVMSVEPGFGGQEFIVDSLNKISKLDEFKKTNSLDELIIQVDGGINEITAKKCLQSGANSLVAGSYLYNATDYKSAYEKISI